jgi:hypothetical protein
VITTFKRKQMGRKYQGKVLFMLVLERSRIPVKVDNYYVCDRVANTTEKYVRVSDMCALLAEVDDRDANPSKINLVPIAHAFPISWIA